MRADGKRLRNVDPMYTVAPHIMDKRNDSQNMIELDIPVGPMQEYIREKRSQGISISHLALVMAAYVRTVAEFPLLNRFIANKNIYARNELAVGMVVLKPGTEEGTMNKVFFDHEDDIFAVNQKLIDYITCNRAEGETNSTDKLISRLLSVPGVLRVGVNCFKILDKFGWLPKSIIDASPFHTSMSISNLGSIRTNHIFHHCYNFGTTSVFITLGNLREVPHRVNGDIVFVRCLPLGVVMDERICGGIYYAKAFHRLKSYLRNPSLLEGPPTFEVKREAEPKRQKKTAQKDQ